jgi:AraC-like DNA-binding protein
MNEYSSTNENHFEYLILNKSKGTSQIEIKESTLFFVLSGNIRVSYNEKVALSVETGNVLLLSCGSSVHIQCTEDATLITCPFHLEKYFTEAFMTELLASPCDNDAVMLSMKGRLPEFVRLLAGYLADQIKMESLHEILKQELFLLLKWYYTKEELARFFYPVMGKDVLFRDFVLKNCLKAETVEALAVLAHYSTSGFVKKFQRYFGESPYKWMLRHKAKRILQDIQLSRKPLKEIAEEYGFSSQSYFYTFCLKQYEKSPSEIRKQGRKLLKEIHE